MKSKKIALKIITGILIMVLLMWVTALLLSVIGFKMMISKPIVIGSIFVIIYGTIGTLGTLALAVVMWYIAFIRKETHSPYITVSLILAILNHIPIYYLLCTFSAPPKTVTINLKHCCIYLIPVLLFLTFHFFIIGVVKEKKQKRALPDNDS